MHASVSGSGGSRNSLTGQVTSQSQFSVADLVAEPPQPNTPGAVHSRFCTSLFTVSMLLCVSSAFTVTVASYWFYGKSQNWAR
jgi:hypothetical protein